MTITFTITELLGVLSGIMGAFGVIIGWIFLHSIRQLERMQVELIALKVQLATIQGRLGIPVEDDR